jgi:LysR family transcriptional regulator, chromosome initiation inhibitor
MALIEQGSFDAAAAPLHVTPCAGTQRIKAREQWVSQVLMVRESLARQRQPVYHRCG